VIDAKNRVFFGGDKFVTTYKERDKKILKLAVLGAQLPAHLIENLPRRHKGAKKN
jgi:hypothetical protein